MTQYALRNGLFVLILTWQASTISAQDSCLAPERIAPVLQKAVEVESISLGPMEIGPSPDLLNHFLSFAFQEHDVLKRKDTLCFYIFTPQVYTIRNGSIVTQTSVLANDDVQRYAASTSSDVYLLHGFSGGDSNLTRLMTDFGLTIQGSDKAIDFFYLFSHLIYGEVVEKRIVGDKLQLITVAARDFRDRYQKGIAESRFQAWLSSSAFRNVKVRPASCKRDGAEFKVSFQYYDAGRVLTKSVLVHNNGHVSEP